MQHTTTHRTGRYALALLGLIGLLALAPWGAARAQNATRYVNAARPDDSGDGLSWATAHKSLQTALAAAQTSDQIWVAAGTYKPTTSTTDRSASFSMKNGVAILGGFPASGNPTLDQRDWKKYPTTLSGDIDGDGTLTGNSYHVIFNNNGLDQTAVLDGFTISGGNADGDFTNSFGGAMYNNQSSPMVKNCSFQRNYASEGGGAIYSNYSTSTIVNCIFQDNSSSQGGAMFNTDSSHPKAINCTFVGNSASSSGGAIANYYLSTPEVINSVFWKNGGINTFMNASNSSLSVRHSLFEVDVMDFTDGGNNLTTATSPFASAATLELAAGSPAINAGNNDATTTPTDLAGNARIRQGTVDMGAYEGLACPSGSNVTLYVNAGVAISGDGSSWSSPLKDLQEALALARSCSNIKEIWVAQGTYTPTTSTTDRNASFSMKNGLAIYGGFKGDETRLAARDWQKYPTTLSGDIDGDGTLTGNSYNVIFNNNTNLDQTAVLDGFTITGGNAESREGGGVFNLAVDFGSVCSPSFSNCSFLNNSATFGGAMSNSGNYGTSSPTLTNCSFLNNSASVGGAMINRGFEGGTSSPTLTNCSFQGNSATDGGAIYNFGHFSGTSSPTLTNCSFQGNSATNKGGAMFNGGFQMGISSPTLTNSVLWNNGGSNTFVYLALDGTASVTMSYSLYENSVTNFTNGGNNLTTATSPFASATSTQLSPCSPALNAGNNDADLDGNGPGTATISSITDDLAGNPRKVGDQVDMGAYEYQGEPNLPLAITAQPEASATFCEGSTATATVAVTGTVTSYQWYKGEQPLQGQTDKTLSLSSATPADAGSYTLRIAGGCGEPITSEPFVLTVDPASVGGTVSGSATVCTGSNSTQLSLSGQVGTVNKWQSSTDGGNTWADIAGTENATSYTAADLTLTTRFRAVVQSGDCAPAFSEAATVTVTQPPVVDAGSCKTIYLGYGESCATLSATANQPNLSYAWTGGLSGVSVQVCPTATTTYTVTATSAAGCESSASVQVEVLDIRSVDKKGKVKIWVCDGKKSKLKKPEHVARYLARGYTLGACGLVPCSGQPAPIAVAVATSCNIVYRGYGSGCVTLEAAATGGYGTLKYNWGPGLDGQSVQVCPEKKTKYTLTVTDAHGYVATEEVEVEVEVRDIRCGKDKAGVELCFQGKNLCVAAGEVAGYLARGARLGKCSDKPCTEEDDEDDRSRIGIAEELSELPVELAVEAYPNPTDGHLTLRVRTSYSGTGIVEVLDLTGRAVQRRTAELQAGDNALELDVAAQPSGLYLLRVRDAAGRQGAVRLLRK